MADPVREAAHPDAGGHLIGRNLRVLGIAQVLAKGAGFAAVVVLARLLDPANFGQYTLAMSVVSLLAVAIELGTSGFLVREAAQRPNELGSILGHVLMVRAALGLVALAASFPLARTLTPDPDAALLIVLFTAATGLRLLASAMHSALQALERMDEVARLQAGSSLLQTVALIGAAAAGGGLAGIGWAMVVTGLVMPFWARARLRRRWQGRIHLSGRGMPLTLRTALAFGLSAGLGTTLTYLDSVMVHAYRGEVDTAMYGAAYRVLLALGVIPIVYADAVTRAISRLAADDREQMGALHRRAVSHLIALAAPVAVGGTILAEPLLRAVFGAAYLDAAPALEILMVSLLLAFPGSVAVTTAYAVGAERAVAAILALAVGGNLIANTVVIPAFGIAGAAAATLAAEAVIVVLVVVLLSRRGVHTGLWRASVRPLAASAAMASCVLPLRAAPLAVPVLIGGAVYAAVLAATGSFDRHDREVLAGFLKTGWAR